MNNEKEAVYKAFSEGIKPDPLLSLPVWMEQHFYLPRELSSKAGLYSFAYNPYSWEIAEEMSPTSPTHTITVLKSAQVGMTTLAHGFLMYCMAHQPNNILLVEPTDKMLTTTSQTKIDPMIDACEQVRDVVGTKEDKKTSNSISLKKFKGGSLRLASAKSAPSLRSSAIRYLILDEMSAYDLDLNSEGDPIALAKQRTVTFRRNRKILQLSTPILKGYDRTEDEFLKSDQRYYFVPCPHCGSLSPLIFSEEYFEGDVAWKRMQWDKDKDGNAIAESAHMVCDGCGNKIEEHQKGWMIKPENGARWVATAEGEDGHAGFFINSLYSPDTPWKDLVAEFLLANARAKKGDKSALQAFVTLKLGEPWKDPAKEIQAHSLYYRRERYNNEVPIGVSLLTVGADLQKDRIEAYVWGWGDGAEAWLIDHKKFYGDPNDITSACYTDLATLLDYTTYKHESGTDLPIFAAGIDSGGGRWAHTLYRFTSRRKGRRVFAVKGESQYKEKALSWLGSRDKTTGAELMFIGTKMIKLYLYEKLGLEEPGRGYFHFPDVDWCDTDFFEQLSSERIVEKHKNGYKVYEFHKDPSTRNEALDCLVYAYGVLEFFRPNYKAMRERYNLDGGVLEIEQPHTREELVNEQVQQEIRIKNPLLHNIGSRGRFTKNFW